MSFASREACFSFEEETDDGKSALLHQKQEEMAQVFATKLQMPDPLMLLI